MTSPLNGNGLKSSVVEEDGTLAEGDEDAAEEEGK